jgi:hypothetical protein
MYKTSRNFAVRLLQACIGDSDRQRCKFATQMHLVTDILMQQFELINAPKERHEMLHAVCYTLATRAYHYELFEDPKLKYKRYWEPRVEPYYWPVPAAFVVAVRAQFTGVIESMLGLYDGTTMGENSIASTKAEGFGAPLDVVIALGRIDQCKLLLSHGAVLDRNPNSSNCRAMEFAAGRGQLVFIEFVLNK